MWKKILVLIGILMAFTILVAPPAMSAQNTIYFLPPHSAIQEPSNNMTVQVRANLSADSPINMWQTNITFDPACVSVIDVTYPAVRNWFSTAPPMGWWSSGEIKIGNVRLNCGDASSDILLANLTIHCEQWGCTSLLNFSGIVNVARFVGCTETLQMYHATWINGTVTIETEEQNGEGRHAHISGSGRGASQPSPSPTLTPTATPTVTETPTLALTITPSASPTPTQTPSSTTLPPTTNEQKRILMLVIGLMAVSIVGIIIYTAFKLRKK